MEKTFINILGGNASGKSTRVGCLVNYMHEKAGSYEPVIYFSNKVKKEIEVGRIYNINGVEYFVVGRFNNKGKWVGLDTADFSTYDSRYKFIKYMFENFNISFFIQEGYFNNRGYAFTKEVLDEQGCGVDKVIEFFILYDKVEQFLERTNNRTGKDRGLDWAENAPGWRDNEGQIKVLKRLQEEGTETELITISIDAKKDYFVEYFFGVEYECPKNKAELEEEERANPKEDTNDILEDW